MTLQEHCRDYLSRRRATYEMRRDRYRVVYQRMLSLGLCEGDWVVDLGAGHCDFGRFLREQVTAASSKYCSLIYHPIDGALDGTDLEVWRPQPQLFPDYFILNEVIEHLQNPQRLLKELIAKKGVILTTPNPETVDVLQCDEDHKTAVTRDDLARWGFEVNSHRFFGKTDDTLVAWRE